MSEPAINPQLEDEFAIAANDPDSGPEETEGMFTLDYLLDMDRTLHFRIKDLELEIKRISEQRDLYSDEIQRLMESQGLERCAKGKSAVTLSQEEAPQTEDWDALYKFINESGSNYLLQKRLSATACMEHIKLEGGLPGVKITKFTKVKIAHRK